MARQNEKLYSIKILFVGEEPSKTALSKNYSWEDGRLCAKQLFDAFKSNGYHSSDAEFINLFHNGDVLVSSLNLIQQSKKPIVAMGRKVQKALDIHNVSYQPMVHPAARGTIRNKENYSLHVKETLKAVYKHYKQLI